MNHRCESRHQQPGKDKVRTWRCSLEVGHDERHLSKSGLKRWGPLVHTVAQPIPMRVLFIDIETKPSKVWTWGLFKQNIGVSQIIEPGGMLCFSAKWFGEETVGFWSEWDDGHEPMVGAAHRLMDQADVVIHYYGSRFDVPHLNAEFLAAGLPVPSPFKQIDLKLAVAKRFRFPSNKLQFVSQALGLPGKVEHEGFPLWTKVMAGDPDARLRMEEYNRQDVELLEDVYLRLLPWIPGHPNRLLWDSFESCPTCGAEDQPVASGHYRTALSVYPQFRCQACGKYFRGSRRVGGVNIQEAAL